MSVVSPTSRYHTSIADLVPATSTEVSSDSRSEDLSSPGRCTEQPPTVSEHVPQSAVTAAGRYVGGPDKVADINSSPTSKKSNPKTNKSSGWKTSKFFSKSMSSCEILRGLKKLSLSSSVEEAEGKGLDVKSLRHRLSSLRKRSSYSNEEVRAVGVDSSTESRPPSLTDSSSPKSSQDEGIVCKKEDILSIISEACKKKPSPSSTRRLPLRQTLSASFETSIEVVRARKEPMRRAGSEEGQPRKSLFADSEDQSPLQDTCGEEVFEDKEALEAKSPQKTNPPEEEGSADDPEWSTVKWDESDVVDAVLLGDAIESFLKVSMTSGEKRVSFRKS